MFRIDFTWHDDRRDLNPRDLAEAQQRPDFEPLEADVETARWWPLVPRVGERVDLGNGHVGIVRRVEYFDRTDGINGYALRSDAPEATIKVLIS